MRMGHEETGERLRERESVTLKDCGVSNGCVCVCFYPLVVPLVPKIQHLRVHAYANPKYV